MMLFWLNKVQLCIPKKLCMMISSTFADPELYKAVSHIHGLRTPNESINQRNLKIMADVADKICFGRTKILGVGVDFQLCSEGDFLTGRP